MKIAVVSHALIQDASRARWRRLAEQHSVEVTLLVPAHWESSWFGGLTVWDPLPGDAGRLHVLPLPVTESRNWGRYFFRSLDAGLRRLRPDVIYVIQEEMTFVLHQMIEYRRLWARDAKLVFFSWNNLRVPQHNWKTRWLWHQVCAETDMAVAGNMEVQEVLRDAGYSKPVVVQTEIGVDQTVFKPDTSRCTAKKSELGLRGFVVGYIGQVRKEKGVLDLVSALKSIQGDWQLLVVGDGPAMSELKDAFAETPERLRAPGYVPIDNIPEYMVLPDVVVLPSQTHELLGFKEQFGLVLAQAMACRVPVIGSSSGAIPEVISDAGLIFPEGDVTALRGCLLRLMNDSALRAELAQRGYERALAKYSATALADETYALFSDLLTGKL